MTDNNTTTTTAADNIHRTPALDKMGLARCRKDNKLFSWRKGGSCKVCGARVEDTPTSPTSAPTVKPKRARKAAPEAPVKGVQTQAERKRCRRVEEEGQQVMRGLALAAAEVPRPPQFTGLHEYRK
jgi:hypothetical protein